MKYANIAAATPVARTYQYLIPEKYQNILTAGFRVIIPFHGRKIQGFVLSITNEKEYDDLKEIISVCEEFAFFDADMLKLAEWMADYYCTGIGMCLDVCSIALKTGGTVQHKSVLFAAEQEYAEKELRKNAKILWKRLYDMVCSEPGIYTKTALAQAAGCSVSPVESLLKRNILIAREEECRNPYLQSSVHEDFFTLIPAQKHAYDSVREILYAKNQHSAYLFGITGSGKTEIYMHLIRDTILQGKQCIVLVPEISLTPQTVKRFRSRFDNSVAVIHSKLSDSERADEWHKVHSGNAKIVIGPRSALFAPVKNLGLIILDEEHENTYKQGDRVRYHARETALKRAEICGAKVIMGSATPSLEQYYAGLSNDSVVPLTVRATGAALPQVIIADMKAEMKAGNRSMFSQAFTDGMNTCLEQGEKAIVFLNRRGYSTFVMCRSCNYVVCCPTCSVSMTYHHGRKNLVCHYCGRELPPPTICPACSGKYIRYFGTGTEKVEAEIQRYFPAAVCERMDSDTTTGKYSHSEIIERFKGSTHNVLVGTQMVAKGLDIPEVTFVGVVAADMSLNLPDFRAAERTFQLLVQVSGRAGRAEKPGIVVIQSYNPDHEAVSASATQDYERFYKSEIEMRREMNLPPFSQMARIVISSENPAEASEHAKKMFEELSEKAAEFLDIEIFGGCPCPLERIKKSYRWHIIIKGNQSFNPFKKELAALHSAKVKIILDIDPVSLL